MKRSVLFFGIVCMAFMLFSVSAQTDVSYFHQIGCSHCAIVQDSGVLERLSSFENVSLTQYEIRYDVKARDNFKYYQGLFNLKDAEIGTPFMVINYSGKLTYLMGDKPIITDSENYAKTGNFTSIIVTTIPVISGGKITLGGIIVAALIDSINPCAFGVLIFLMISMLKVGSAKRARRYGLIYSFFVFLTYFLAGFGIFKAIQSLAIFSKIIYIVLGFFVLLMALLEFYDYFKTIKGKESILKIPTRAKPIIEKVMSNGTLPAIVLAGILVSLFELPCTGGIYLAILTSMAQNQTFSFLYLFLYNIIFVLPLIVITWIVYKGESTQFLHDWTNRNKKWMKLLAGIVLIALGLYILKGKLF